MHNSWALPRLEQPCRAVFAGSLDSICTHMPYGSAIIQECWADGERRGCPTPLNITGNYLGKL